MDKFVSGIARSFSNKPRKMSSSSSAKPPARLNKASRRSFAKQTINHDIPRILKSNERALDGVRNSELIHYAASLLPPRIPSPQKLGKQPAGESSKTREEQSGSISPDKSGESPAVPEGKAPRVRVVQSDTYDAVQAIIESTGPGTRVAALNMASALHPGGGVLHGAVAQEEELCIRSTLYPSLNEAWYRIPDDAAIYTPDVLVFRDSTKADLPPSQHFFTDVISCAAIKHPYVVVERDEEGTRVQMYEHTEDYELMLKKVRLILQIATQKGITHLVLGALGCGAYMNPPLEVAEIFKKVICGGKKRVGVTGIEDIVFAIFDDGENLRVFREVFS